MTGYESKRVGRCLLLHTPSTIRVPGGVVLDSKPFLLNIDHIETVIAPSIYGAKVLIETANDSYYVEETFDEIMALMDPRLLGKFRMKGFIKVRDLDDNAPVLVNVNSILYVFSEKDPETQRSHAVLFFGHKQSFVECIESYDTVRMMIADAIDD